MSTLERDINEYLFHEFGLDLDGGEERISDAWPFVLSKVGEHDGMIVFEFDDGEPFFAFAGESLNFLPKAGMTFEDLCLQRAGGRWIGARDPVDLATSMPGDPGVPSGLDRQAAIRALGEGALPSSELKVLEGLFLRAEQRYIAIFEQAGDDAAVIVGLSATPMQVPFAGASPWRRLAWGVGRWLQGPPAALTV
jgi:hypothetical protein